MEMNFLALWAMDVGFKNVTMELRNSRRESIYFAKPSHGNGLSQAPKKKDIAAVLTNEKSHTTEKFRKGLFLKGRCPL